MNVQKVNYQKELDKILDRIRKEGKVPSLLLHSCCAPCSSYVLEYLREKFDITVLYYNPNITEWEEYEKRSAELKRLARQMNQESAGAGQPEKGSVPTEPTALPSGFILVEEGEWEPQRFFEVSKGLENLPEGGERCFRCYELRLRETARIAAERGFDYFTTTLTISPLKNAEKLNVCAVFDNEEVGSRTKQGADSTFLTDTACRIRAALGIGEAEWLEKLPESFMLSADNAHAVHPNYAAKCDETNRCYLNGGIVVKYSANQKYTTDAVSASVFGEICRRAGVPVMVFHNRSDMAGGSTLGNIANAHLSLNTVDIGIPQLAMHACVETAGARDTDYMVRAMTAFYEADIRRTADGAYTF